MQRRAAGRFKEGVRPALAACRQVENSVGPCFIPPGSRGNSKGGTSLAGFQRTGPVALGFQ